MSTLSNWQRGAGRPRGPQGLRALTELERLLDVRPGSLARLLDEPVGRGRRATAIPGTPVREARRLRARLDPDRDPGLAELAVHHDVTVSEHGWETAVRLVVRSRRTGADRHVVLAHATNGTVPLIRTGRDCRLGRVCADPAQALLAAEILLPPLDRGETFTVEYRTTGSGEESYHGHWFRTPGQRYELTVRLPAARGYRHAARIWRLDSRLPHKDVARLRLIGGTVAHLLDPDVAPGFHGIRWAR
ncbi:hypothetical protein [Kitasatospora terrestris]|uniref:XRE family transcriptional regulator n=1 Tax=Kitasatospora terrestris TaxID=258051 RepID=A0ABP9EBU0_9ACTN